MNIVDSVGRLFGGDDDIAKEQDPIFFLREWVSPLLLAGGIIETFGGLFLLLGLFTRPVAFIKARWLLLTSSSTHRRDSGRC